MKANENFPTYERNDARERAVRGFLAMVEEFGFAAERFFDRIYRGLNRKRARTGVPGSLPDPDQMSALRQANRELTQRVRDAENISTRLQAVLASISEGVIVQDTEGRIVLMNEAAYTLLGNTKAFWESELARLFEQAHGAPIESEMELVGKPVRIQANNRILGAQLAAVATPGGQPLGTLMVLRDVTREALADRLKDEFITQITHELRTPLTAIKGMSEVLLGQPEDRPPNRKFLDAIARNAAILDRMIVELIDISEISTGTFGIRHDELALDEIILDVIKGQESRFKKAGLNIGMMVANRTRIKVRGDDRRLRWAIGHLIDNSINYTPPGGHITIRIGIVQGERVLIEVIDNGVGISEKDLPHIFERFYRGEARTAAGKAIDPRGLGQGLFIARAVAEAHGGYLAGMSTLGKGSKFTLGLPYLAPVASPQPAA